MSHGVVFRGSAWLINDKNRIVSCSRNNNTTHTNAHFACPIQPNREEQYTKHIITCHHQHARERAFCASEHIHKFPTERFTSFFFVFVSFLFCFLYASHDITIARYLFCSARECVRTRKKQFWMYSFRLNDVKFDTTY